MTIMHNFAQHHENIQFYWWVGSALSLFTYLDVGKMFCYYTKIFFYDIKIIICYFIIITIMQFDMSILWFKKKWLSSSDKIMINWLLIILYIKMVVFCISLHYN